METAEIQIREYLERLSSKEPVPGGGGASALAGAFGVSLGLMEGNLTLGKKKYREYEAEIRDIQEKLTRIREDFLRLSDEDEAVFLPLSRAYGLPRESAEQENIRSITLEKCLCDATDVPVKVMEKAMEALNLMEMLAEHGSRLSVSDVGVGVQFLETALSGAIMNVYINTKMMQDREHAVQMIRHAETLRKAGVRKAQDIFDKVEKSICRN